MRVWVYFSLLSYASPGAIQIAFKGLNSPKSNRLVQIQFSPTRRRYDSWRSTTCCQTSLGSFCTLASASLSSRCWAGCVALIISRTPALLTRQPALNSRNDDRDRPTKKARYQYSLFTPNADSFVQCDLSKRCHLVERITYGKWLSERHASTRSGGRSWRRDRLQSLADDVCEWKIERERWERGRRRERLEGRELMPRQHLGEFQSWQYTGLGRCIIRSLQQTGIYRKMMSKKLLSQWWFLLCKCVC